MPERLRNRIHGPVGGQRQGFIPKPSKELPIPTNPLSLLKRQREVVVVVGKQKDEKILERFPKFRSSSIELKRIRSEWGRGST